MKKQLHTIFMPAAFVCVSFLMPSTIHAQVWTALGTGVSGPITAGGDGGYFGHSVSMPDDKTFAAGAWSFADVGAVMVYKLQGTTWVQKGDTIYSTIPTQFEDFGTSVSMPDTNTVAIGAEGSDTLGASPVLDKGSVRVYNWSGGNWVQKGATIYGSANNKYSGHSVSMPDANTVGIGETYFNDPVYIDGSVRVFTWNGSAWVQKGADLIAEAPDDVFGYSVSMPDANTIAVGAPFNSNGRGHVRVFNWNGSAWVQKGADIDGVSAIDKSGSSVSMPDANTVAVGAPENAAAGNYAGAVKVYSWSGSAWVAKGAMLTGDGAADQFGRTVSMPDANTLGVGAPEYGVAYGQLQVYSWNGSAWVLKGATINSFSGRLGFSISMPNPNTIAGGRATAFNGQGRVEVYSTGPYNNIAENSFGSGLIAYPNPVQNRFTIGLGDEYETVELSIRNVVGQLVSEQTYKHAAKITTEVNGEPGIYFVQLKSGNSKTAVLRVLKQ